MVFSYLYNLVSYYYGYSESDRMNNVPFKMSGLNEESLQEAIKNLKPVTNDFTIKLRAEIAENESRTDHIRTEDDIKNNKPIDEFELSKAKNCKIQVLECTSMDLRGYINNLRKTNVEPPEEINPIQIIEEIMPSMNNEIKYDNILDEINAIGDVESWFRRRKINKTL